MVAFRRLTLLICLLLPQAAMAQLDFDRDIRPILSDHCFPCHGPDEATREAGLRLDQRTSALESGALVPGDPPASGLWQRITATDADLQMPPPEAKLALSAEQQETLRAWIAGGAPWQTHWSLEPLRRPQPPAVESDWPRNPIDRFTLARMREHGLEPSPSSPRTTLLRRVTLDLTGLPPTLEEIDAFLADEAPGAYERVVDRLLASPQYGERMAWDWLDAARYADTDGFQGDPTRSMWPWRDWLVRQLNANQPFDQMTIEMLAGDLLPDATDEQILATAFNRNHMHNGEGGRIPEETRVENVFDRTETTATVWLGLTMTCCRCHDHKYDPLSMQEYFQLYAFFDNTSETGQRAGGQAPPLLQYLSPPQRQQRESWASSLAELKRRLEAPLPDLDARQPAWEALQRETLEAWRKQRPSLSAWSALGPVPAPGDDAAASYAQDPGSLRDLDPNAEFGDPPLRWRAEPDWTDGNVHPLPNVVGATYLGRTIQAPQATRATLLVGSDDGLQVWLNGKQVFEKRVNRAAAPDQERIEVELVPGANRLLLKIVNTGGIGGFAFRLDDPRPEGLTAAAIEALETPAAKRTAEQRQSIQAAYRARNWPEWETLQAQRRHLETQLEQLKPVPVMVMDELPPERRRTTRMLARGAYDQPGEPVQPATPAVLPPLPESAPANRLTLARWLMADEQPLTARVTVNRHWQTFFGRGLVDSPEDFGVQGKRPTHPQLLDWLAAEFRESGWDVKGLHRLLVTSATYRQSSRVSATHLERDPANIYLARRPRYRMPSWMLRDQALAASGLLVETPGGPPVNSYQPAGVWSEATFGQIRYQPGTGDQLYRRSLYLFWRRIVGPTMLFDTAKRQTCEVQPTRTNTPLHALTLLNDVTYVEAARQLAQRCWARHPEDRAATVNEAFRRLTARHPSESELTALLEQWQEMGEFYRAHPQEAQALLEVGESPVDDSLQSADLAALSLVCATLLNLDEVLSLE